MLRVLLLTGIIAFVSPLFAQTSSPSVAPSLEQRVADLEAYVTNSPRGADLGSAGNSNIAAPGPSYNAWMMTCAALVLFMTLPGLALFYGGLVRAKNVLSVLAQCLGIAGLGVLVALIGWFAWGVFAHGSIWSNVFVVNNAKAPMHRRIEAAMALASAKRPEAGPRLLMALRLRSERDRALEALAFLGRAAPGEAVEAVDRLASGWLTPGITRVRAAYALVRMVAPTSDRREHPGQRWLDRLALHPRAAVREAVADARAALAKLDPG